MLTKVNVRVNLPLTTIELLHLNVELPMLEILEFTCTMFPKTKTKKELVATMCLVATKLWSDLKFMSKLTTRQTK
jgi:hypothetical protein